MGSKNFAVEVAFEISENLRVKLLRVLLWPSFAFYEQEIIYIEVQCIKHVHFVKNSREPPW